MFRSGQIVRLKNDVSSIGTITGPARDRNGETYYRVNINGISGYQPEYALELFNENQGWEELLEQKKFGRPRNLRQQLTHIHLNGKLANLVYSMEATTTDFYR